MKLTPEINFIRIIKNKIILGSLCALGTLPLNPSTAHAQTYSGSSNLDLSKSLVSIQPTPFVTNSIHTCSAGTVINGITYTAASAAGALYSVGDYVYLNDGSELRLTSVGDGGTLIDGGWTVLAYAKSTTDAAASTETQYTTSVATNSKILNAKASGFIPGCFVISTQRLPATTQQLGANPELQTHLDVLVPDMVNNPDGAWPRLNKLINSVDSTHGYTFRMSADARFPFNWGSGDPNASAMTIDANNYNALRILADNDMWNNVDTTGDSPEWNGGLTWASQLPESVLVEGFSPRYGDITARRYHDPNLYLSDSDPYRGVAPLETKVLYDDVDDSARTNSSCGGFPGWQANNSYTAGSTIIVQVSGSYYQYVATVGGTSSSSSPVFTGKETSTFTDGTVTWELVGATSSDSDPRYSSFGWCNGNTRDLDRGGIVWDAYSSNTQGLDFHENNFYSHGFGGYGGFDINEYNTMMHYGTNWSWVQVNQLSEVGNIALGYYTNAADKSGWVGSGKMNYVEEWDMSGIGIEDPSTYYNPSAGNRIVWWFSDWENGGISWSASLPVKAYTVLLVPDSSGQAWMYVAKNSGVTGTTEPAFTFNETSPITDGGVTWVFQGKQKFQISRFMGVDKNHGGTGNFADIEYGTLFASSGVIYNAILDFSQSSFTSDVDDGIHALVRTPNGTMWDGSADGTRSGQNNNLFGYNNKWLFESKQSDGSFASSFGVFSGENGAFKGTTDALHYNLIPAGSSINDATTIDTKITVFDTVPNDGMGLRLPTSASVAGTVIEIKNDTNKLVNLYPIDTGWGIAGANAKGDPLELLPGMDTRLVYHGGTSNIIEQLDGTALSLYTLTDSNISELVSWKYHSNGVVLFDSDKHTPIAYDARNGTWMSMSTIPYNAALTLAAIEAQTHTEGEKIWCHDCRAPSQATGAGTGRWIYKDSAGTWRTEDGLEATD